MDDDYQKMLKKQAKRAVSKETLEQRYYQERQQPSVMSHLHRQLIEPIVVVAAAA